MNLDSWHTANNQAINYIVLYKIKVNNQLFYVKYHIYIKLSWVAKCLGTSDYPIGVLKFGQMLDSGRVNLLIIDALRKKSTLD